MPLIHIACNTLILTHSEDAFVGRVNSILNPLFMGGMLINMSLAGVLKDLLSLNVMYPIASSLFAIGTLAVLPMLRIKQMKADKALPQ